MYLGTQGVRRNIEAVAKLYKMGAENKDPAATFNYGLSLLKVSLKILDQGFYFIKSNH